jgi:hypothetical protein
MPYKAEPAVSGTATIRASTGFWAFNFAVMDTFVA